MAPLRNMQMLITRFERLSRRISLAGMMSGHKAEEAIAAGRVMVDGKVATANFKVFSEALVDLDGKVVPPPQPNPRLWAMRKPKKVLCQSGEHETMETLVSTMRKWREKEQLYLGSAMTQGLQDESLDDKHFIVVSPLSFGADGLVLMTNDALFADAIRNKENRILTEYEVKVSGDPPINLLHSWRHGARAGGINFGQVFASIATRSPSASRLKIRYVESPDRPLELLLDSANIRVNRLRRHAIGSYVETALPSFRLVPVPVHKSLLNLVPAADMRQVLVPARGGLLNQDGRLRSMVLDESVVLGRTGKDGADVPADVGTTSTGATSGGGSARGTAFENSSAEHAASAVQDSHEIDGPEEITDERHAPKQSRAPSVPQPTETCLAS